MPSSAPTPTTLPKSFDHEHAGSPQVLLFPLGETARSAQGAPVSAAATVADNQHPALAPMYRLQFEPAQDCWVLLYPEGLVKLNGPASEILRRCDGKASVAEITADLEKTFNETSLRGDVGEFLGDAYERGWIV